MNERIVLATAQYYYKRMIEDMNEVCRVYPFVRVSYIGYSVLGKPIPVIQIGTGEKSIHYNGAFHANEWITSLILMVFLEDYARAVQSNECILNQRALDLYSRSTLFIVPMVNPDGVDLVVHGLDSTHVFYEKLHLWNNRSTDFSQWKSNIRGIDLNDQFPAFWDVEKERRSPDGPGPRDFPGDQPLSEPEAVAIAQLTKDQMFHLIIALHTQGKEIYWNYRDMEPETACWMAEQMARVSGFDAVKLTDSDAGYKDWFIQHFRRPGFTVEAGLGCNPLPITQFEKIYAEVAPILVLGLDLV